MSALGQTSASTDEVSFRKNIIDQKEKKTAGLFHKRKKINNNNIQLL